MIQFFVDQASVDALPDWMDLARQRILAGVRSGMAEGMELMAENTVEAMQGAGIENRTGALESNILKSPRVSEDDTTIRGRVTAFAPVKARGGELYYNNLGNILDKGFHDPKEKYAPHQITAADGDTFWARGHVAFDIKPHPFFRQALAVSESPIMDIIRRRIKEASE